MMGNEDLALSVTVVIPTYRRPAPLIACIRSIVSSSRQPSEIIVVGRDDDGPTKEALIQAQDLCRGKVMIRAGWVTEPGHLPPVQEGLHLASTQIVAFVDDDVTVAKDWLIHLVAPFTDPKVAVVGGRVLTPASRPPRLKGRPGWTSWYGKHWANIASVEGESPVDVQGVMECNWAWRCDSLMSLRFDPVLNFDDAAMYGLDLCLQARSKDLRVIYEPRALVHHHAVPRSPELDRSDRSKRSFSYTRNYTYIMLRHLAWWQRPVFLAWWFLVGERGSWGLGSVLADTFTGHPPPVSHIWSTLSGKIEGILISCSPVRGHG